MAPKKPNTQPPSVTPNQLRAARALLRWSMQDLADKSGRPFETIRSFESRGETFKLETIAPWRETLEAAGIEFIEPDEKGGPGVRLKLAKKKR